MDTIVCAIMVPEVETVVHNTGRRPVLRQRRTLATRAANLHQHIDDLAYHDRPFVAALLGGWGQRRNVLHSFAGIAQPASVTTPRFPFAHIRKLLQNRASTRNS